MLVRLILVALSSCLPLTSQVTLVAAECPPTAVSSSAFVSLSVQNPVAGSSLSYLISGRLVALTTPCPSAPALSVMVIGFNDPGIALPSCGCSLHASLNSLDAAVSPFVQFLGLCFAVHSGSLPLPPGSAGLTIYTQAFTLLPPAANAPGVCTDFGFPFVTSQSYQVTIQ